MFIGSLSIATLQTEIIKTIYVSVERSVLHLSIRYCILYCIYK